MTIIPRKKFWDSLRIDKNQYNVIPGMIFLASGLLRVQFVEKEAPDDKNLALWTPILASFSFVVGWYIALFFEKAEAKRGKNRIRWLLLIITIGLFFIGVILGEMKYAHAVLTIVYTLGSGYFFRLSVIKEAPKSSTLDE